MSNLGEHPAAQLWEPIPSAALLMIPYPKSLQLCFRCKNSMLNILGVIMIRHRARNWFQEFARICLNISNSTPKIIKYPINRWPSKSYSIDGWHWPQFVHTWTLCLPVQHPKHSKGKQYLGGGYNRSQQVRVSQPIRTYMWKLKKINHPTICSYGWTTRQLVSHYIYIYIY